MTAPVAAGATTAEVILYNPREPSAFRFVSYASGEKFWRNMLTVGFIGKPLPPKALDLLPDVARLGNEMKVAEFDVQTKPDAAQFKSMLVAWVPKFAIAMGAPPEKLKEIAPEADLDLLRKRDRELSATYRAALSKQGFRFSTDLHEYGKGVARDPQK